MVMNRRQGFQPLPGFIPIVIGTGEVLNRLIL